MPLSLLKKISLIIRKSMDIILLYILRIVCENIGLLLDIFGGAAHYGGCVTRKSLSSQRILFRYIISISSCCKVVIKSISSARAQHMRRRTPGSIMYLVSIYSSQKVRECSPLMCIFCTRVGGWPLARCEYHRPDVNVKPA